MTEQSQIPFKTTTWTELPTTPPSISPAKTGNLLFCVVKSTLHINSASLDEPFIKINVISGLGLIKLLVIGNR